MAPRCRSRSLRMRAHGRGGAAWLEGLRRPHARKPFTVPVSIASRHTANKVLKDARLPKAF